MLSLSFVTGTEPDKWFSRYRERTEHGELLTQAGDDPFADLEQGSADLVLMRLPDSRVEAKREDLHVVELYEETPGIALPADHTLTLLERLSDEDIAEETCNYQTPESGEIDIPALRSALQVVAANVGIARAPRPLLKSLCGKLVEHREFEESAPRTRIALVWEKEADCDAIQDFVGIAKGRTANSSRQAQPKRSAREKAKQKAARRAAGRKKPRR